MEKIYKQKFVIYKQFEFIYILRKIKILRNNFI